MPVETEIYTVVAITSYLSNSGKQLRLRVRKPNRSIRSFTAAYPNNLTVPYIVKQVRLELDIKPFQVEILDYIREQI